MANHFIIVFWLLSNYKIPEEKLYSKLLTLDKQQLYISKEHFLFSCIYCMLLFNQLHKVPVNK